jgi:predicted nucleic acid-binding protein
MSYLLDVNMLVTCAWHSHARHYEAKRWCRSLSRFATCSAAQMGFLRVSMSPAYKATFQDARNALADILRLPAHEFLIDDTTAAELPELKSRHHISDAHLVALAERHGLLLATFDEPLCDAHWAAKIAVNPLKFPASGE